MPEEVKIGLSKATIPVPSMVRLAAIVKNPLFITRESVQSVGQLFTKPHSVWDIVDGMGVCANAVYGSPDPNASNGSAQYQAELAIGIKSAFETIVVLYANIRSIQVIYEESIPVEIDESFSPSEPWINPVEADVSNQFDALLKLASSTLTYDRKPLEPFLTGFNCGRSIAYDLLAHRHNRLIDKFEGIGEDNLDQELKELIEANTE